jgi:hypothetical protein
VVSQLPVVRCGKALLNFPNEAVVDQALHRLAYQSFALPALFAGKAPELFLQIEPEAYFHKP